MNKVLRVTGWIVLILIVVASIAWFGFFKPEPPPISDEDRNELSIMPLPADLKLKGGVFPLDESLNHRFTGLSTPRLERAVTRFYRTLSNRSGVKFQHGSRQNLLLECTGSEMNYPTINNEESYSIKISKRSIHVKAPSETGILYGLESLLQLIRNNDGQYEWPSLQIDDTPRYPWRGLMIDVCRHWITKETIMRNLDAMAAVKMNVLHLHLTEHQGFRIESKRYPLLHEMGSNGDFYTQEEILEMIEYAADRGIRIVPEFDIPGHTAAWFVGHPELASAPGPYFLDSVMLTMKPVMDPTSEEVYHFLDQFFNEMSGLFPDAFMHIGGDEVNPTHWNDNPDIQQFMVDHNLIDNHALQAHFNNRIKQILDSNEKTMLGWDEILHPALPGDGVVVQTWRDHGSLWESARQGNLAILSAGYYLDHKQSAGFHYQVDPTIIPGAVDIEIDSTNWKGWSCVLKIADMSMDGEIYLFGEGDMQRGIMKFMGTSTGFTEVSLLDNQFLFMLETPMGTLEFNTHLYGDSIAGSAKLSVFNLQLNGKRSGGTDMKDGLALPEFKKIEPLTPDQEANLIGGEACMWSEMVDDITLESRIWPRASAIAEKLWSPLPLTNDIDDMYRRLMHNNAILNDLGIKHQSYRKKLIEEMAGKSVADPLETLVGLLQEEKMFNRLSIYQPAFNYTTPLNRVVDAAPPESYLSLMFNHEVERWLEKGDDDTKSNIQKELNKWLTIHEKLGAAFKSTPGLKEIENHAINLSELAHLGLMAINDPGSLKGNENKIHLLLSSAGKPSGGTILAIVEPVKKLVDSALRN